jgi:hypothetical protein
MTSLRVGPNPIILVSLQETQRHTDREEKMPSEDTHSRKTPWSGVKAEVGLICPPARNATNYQQHHKLRERHETDVPQSLWREHGPITPQF